MLIAHGYIQFCAEKTRDVIAQYDRDYGSTIDDRFWRSADELHGIMTARHNLPIFHKQLKVHWHEAKYRSFYVPFPDKFHIWYARDLPPLHLRYHKTKELLQIELWKQSLVTTDIPELVRNMILRESPTSVDLDLGEVATSDTLGEIAAAEFLFPLQHRQAYLAKKPAKNGIQQLSEEYQIPPFLVQRSLSHVTVLAPFFV